MWRRVFDDLAAGRMGALDDLYDLAAADVYRLALWRTGDVMDAEDVVQNVFVKVAEQGCRLARVRQPRRWLLTVARRCAVDCVRRRARCDADELREAPYLVALSNDPGRSADARTVSRLVDRLPPPQREVVLLRLFADCTFAAIGRITRVPTFTAASRYRLAIARLRRLLEGDHEATR
jgi:RNA polymerase sigma-70 factor (ECF subfamily)